MPAPHRSFALAVTLVLACSLNSEGAGSEGESATTGTGTTAATEGTSPSDAADTVGADQDPVSEADDGDPEATGCCEAHPMPGCDELEVATCVCEMDAVCCTFEWDQNCVNTARDRCAATCEPDAADDESGDPGTDGAGDATDGPGDDGGTGDCCVPSQQPGCGDATMQMCVCEQDAFCCEREWDFQCVMTANQACGASCASGGTGCCDLHMAPGCDDMMVQNCVCDVDPFCCDEGWDDQCVQIADGQCDAMCGG